ncbi:MAG: hypothetical protein AB2L14_25915 [Candidatus Xenobiia bacterium LiM19]
MKSRYTEIRGSVLGSSLFLANSSLQSVNCRSWQNGLESALNNLNRYAYCGGTYRDLYSAARGTDYVTGEVSQAQYSVHGIALKKKAAAKKKNR